MCLTPGIHPSFPCGAVPALVLSYHWAPTGCPGAVIPLGPYRLPWCCHTTGPLQAALVLSYHWAPTGCPGAVIPLGPYRLPWCCHTTGPLQAALVLSYHWAPTGCPGAVIPLGPYRLPWGRGLVGCVNENSYASTYERGEPTHNVVPQMRKFVVMTHT